MLVPDFPNSQEPVLEEWLAHFDDILKTEKLLGQTSSLVMIGHSLGAPFILRFLERLPPEQRIEAAYLVAAFHRPLGVREIENFVNKPFNWKKIRRSCRKFFVINSDNDPYISLEIGRDLAQKLAADLLVEAGGDHLNAPARTQDGLVVYPRLLELVCS
jgi:predicted alpha/beta hydrolase family esterase